MTKIANGRPSGRFYKQTACRGADPFENAVLKFASRVEQWALQVEDDVAAAEDLFQTIVLKAWEANRKGQFQPQPGRSFENSVAAFLITIMRNEFSTAERNRRGRQSVCLDYKGCSPDLVVHTPASQIGAIQLSDTGLALQGLPPAQRDSLIGVVTGQSYQEIAEVLNVSPTTVRVNVSRARKRLEGCNIR